MEDNGPDDEEGAPSDVTAANLKGANIRINPPMMAFPGLRQV